MSYLSENWGLLFWTQDENLDYGGGDGSAVVVEERVDIH